MRAVSCRAFSTQVSAADGGSRRSVAEPATLPVRGPVRRINPMTYADRTGEGRRVRFLVGADDPLVRTEDARACAARFPDGDCYVVPGLGHGGDALAGHVQTAGICALALPAEQVTRK